jgi:CRP-like cAMP-binding protein
MYGQLAGAFQLPYGGSTISDVPRSGQLDALIALAGIGTRLRFSRNQEIYGQGEASGFWYKIISGTVRISKLRTDGRRHIAEFCFSGDGFGLESGAARSFSAEAVEDVTVMRYPCPAAERLSEENPAVARLLRDMTLRSLAAAQGRLMILARMTATERVVSFLLELSERNDDEKCVELPMCRCDIGDYLGVSTETVCRCVVRSKASRRDRGLPAIGYAARPFPSGSH